ncbi:Lrp/AsnC family transcriptional regulator [Tahibacter harae]|uniref:Lrp/AsnC family transcriptional regulator n=1 Tax=Tahibacter harae TaxID=2963937 RepID=A0ABT1QZ19_9GAMM|nr:Lrp/AsnC family transcriptional regulator [Tahibacter harae]MCQ4167503.1 Lrp/AsnC family transcriptional regulator [Tahibacter harae]
MNAVDAIDAKDRLLLDLLYRNARLPLKTIAARVGLARSSVRERVARLESRGVIRGYRADVEWPAALPAIQAYFTLRLKHTPAPGLVRRLRERPELERCCSIGGEIDLILSARAESLLALNSLRDWLAEQAEVASVVTSVVLNEEFRR